MSRNITLITLGAALLLGSCKTDSPKKSKKSPIIETIDGVQVTTDEFEYVYRKNNSRSEDAYSKASIDEYLDLYTNFRLKVREAESLGYDTTNEFKKEFKDYERQLAEPYLTEKSVSEKLLKEAYDRSTKEVSASHLLIMSKPEDSPKDTLVAFNKIKKYREMIVGGNADFADIAKRFSEDPSAKQNGGNLGYFSALQMVYPFENAAFNTAVGEVSQPVKSKFGYHILKVHDLRSARGQVKAAHIMRRATEGMDEVDLKEAESKINEIHKKLSSGADWNSLCKQFSEDGASASKGGALQWFGAGQMPKEFDESAFGLKEKGEISKPVKTAYGYHIIKLLDKKEIDSFEKMKPELETKIQRDIRSQLPKEAFIKRIKVENKFIENKATKELVFKAADSTFLTKDWKYDESNENYKKTLFSISGKDYSGNDFLNFMKKQVRPKKGASAYSVMQNNYKRYSEGELIEYEKAHLAEKYIDYKMLLREYRDGILLFKLMDERVWSKAVQDTSGLNKFHKGNSSKYMWGERAQTLIVNAVDEVTLKQVQEDLKSSEFISNRIKISPIAFIKKEVTLKDATQSELDKIVGFMNGDDKLSITINGYTDSYGKDASNVEIGRKRAEFAKKYIVDRGVSEERVSTKSFGEANPVASNKTTQGKASNNRIDFSIYSTSPKTLEEKYNKDNSLTLTIVEGLFEKGGNAMLDEAEWKVGESIIEKEGRKIYINVSEMKAIEEKKLSECRGLVISDFQNHLEKQWVKDLKTKYPVVIYQDEVQKLIKQ